MLTKANFRDTNFRSTQKAIVNLITTYFSYFRSGQKEHAEMGARWRERLGILEEDDIEVIATTKQRTIASAQAFLTEFIGNNDTEINVNTKEVDGDKDIRNGNNLLRFYDKYPKYQEEVKKNETTYKEIKEFLKSEHFRYLAKRVRNKTGANLTIPDISLLWQMCRCIFPLRNSILLLRVLLVLLLYLLSLKRDNLIFIYFPT